MPVEEAVDLYAVEPAEFVAARNELVRRLKAEGRKDDAAVVAKLRRPTPAAWALNQVARSHPGLLTAAVEAGEHLRRASDAVVTGGAGDLREASAGERAAADAVLAEATKALGAKGPATRAAMAGILRAAALDGDVAQALRQGVLSGEPGDDDGGFGFSAGLEPGPARAGDEPKPPRPSARQKAEAERLRREATRLADAADAAEEAARRARRAAADAATAADAAEAALQ